MSLILSGTDGLSDVDGTAATPAIRGTDANTGIFFGADIIGFSEGGVEAARINADSQFVAAAGTAALPVITTTGDLNTGIFFPAADTIAFSEGGAEAMRITSAGDVGIGTTSTAGNRLRVVGTGVNQLGNWYTISQFVADTTNFKGISLGYDSSSQTGIIASETGSVNSNLAFWTFGGGFAERARIDSSGNLLVAKTTTNSANVGIELLSDGRGNFTVSNNEVLNIRRLASDGNLIRFYQDTTEEGNISVSGSTVSYNGGHLSRYAQTTTAKDDSLVKGTVLSNLDEMNVYTDAEGNSVNNEQLNKVKVSDVEGDTNVAGVFVNWAHDDAHDVDEINMAMTGDMIIRIAQGVTVARGDLLMSAGNGTAKPQGDDIIRSKTVAKVTSTHVTCTYADGSFCVPCVLMAC